MSIFTVDLIRIGDFPAVARASSFKGSTQSKRWWIESIYRYKQAKASRIELNIWNCILTLFTLNYINFDWSHQSL